MHCHGRAYGDLAGAEAQGADDHDQRQGDDHGEQGESESLHLRGRFESES